MDRNHRHALRLPRSEGVSGSNPLRDVAFSSTSWESGTWGGRPGVGKPAIARELASSASEHHAPVRAHSIYARARGPFT
jgi:hypothetical protein